jgi:HEAT repeat protein
LPRILEELRRGDLDGLGADQRDTWTSLVELASDAAGLVPDLALQLLEPLARTDALLVAQVASGLGDPRFAPLLADLTRHPSSAVRWVAVQALALHSDAAVTEILLSRLRDRSKTVRVATIQALVAHGDEGAAAELTTFARSIEQKDPELSLRAELASKALSEGRGGHTLVAE